MNGKNLYIYKVWFFMYYIFKFIFGFVVVFVFVVYVRIVKGDVGELFIVVGGLIFVIYLFIFCWIVYWSSKSKYEM